MGLLRQPARSLTSATPGDGATDLQRSRAELPKPLRSTAFSVTTRTQFLQIWQSSYLVSHSETWPHETSIIVKMIMKPTNGPLFSSIFTCLSRKFKQGAETLGDRVGPTFIDSCRGSCSWSPDTEDACLPFPTLKALLCGWSMLMPHIPHFPTQSCLPASYGRCVAHTLEQIRVLVCTCVGCGCHGETEKAVCSM